MAEREGEAWVNPYSHTHTHTHKNIKIVEGSFKIDPVLLIPNWLSKPLEQSLP
jgi:hypothetical protein